MNRHIILLILLGCLPALGDEGENHKDKLSALATAYQANREAAQSFDCTFEVRRGKTTSLDLAMQGVLDEQVEMLRGRWISSTKFTRYELLCDPAVNERTKQRL